MDVFSNVKATSATTLRQLLKRSESIREKERLVKALTLCSDARDLLTFKNLFLETPKSSVFAFAILLCFPRDVENYWIADIDNPTSELFALGRHFGELPTFERLYKQTKITSDFDLKESLMERWIQCGQPFEVLDDPSKSLSKLAGNIKLLQK